MVHEFRMPDVGEGLTEATILTWCVKPGDPVTDGQVVCEVETAKAAVELPVPFTGVVGELLFPEGASVDVGAVIITVEAGEEAAGRQPVLVGYGVGESATTRRRRRRPASPEGARTGTEDVLPLAKPPVRKLAKDLGVDLRVVTPSGPGGVITRDDVHKALALRPKPPHTPPASTPVHDDGRTTRVPIKGVRKATARAMVSSAFTAPHVTEFVTVDVTRTMKLVEGLKQDKAFEGLKVSPLLPVAKALLVALSRNPAANATWDEANQEIVHRHYVNLGIAVATPRGLIVPNIKDAHVKTLSELAAELSEMVSTARAGRTSPAAMQGGTVTITNIGIFGVDAGTPILNPGESAILAVGAIKLRPWVHKEKARPRQVTTLALSFDHRLVDGELGSKVLADTAAVLEHPKRLIAWS